MSRDSGECRSYSAAQYPLKPMPSRPAFSASTELRWGLAGWPMYVLEPWRWTQVGIEQTLFADGVIGCGMRFEC